MRWADYQFEQPENFNGADNGVLQIHLLKTLLPEASAEIKACDAIWRKGTGYETYMNFVTCCKVIRACSKTNHSTTITAGDTRLAAHLARQEGSHL